MKFTFTVPDTPMEVAVDGMKLSFSCSAGEIQVTITKSSLKDELKSVLHEMVLDGSAEVVKAPGDATELPEASPEAADATEDAEKLVLKEYPLKEELTEEEQALIIQHLMNMPT